MTFSAFVPFLNQISKFVGEKIKHKMWIKLIPPVEVAVLILDEISRFVFSDYFYEVLCLNDNDILLKVKTIVLIK